MNRYLKHFLYFFLSDECHETPMMISQYWFRKWLDAIRQQAITWANVVPDLCCLIVSLDHNKLSFEQVAKLCYDVLCIIRDRESFKHVVSMSLIHMLSKLGKYCVHTCSCRVYQHLRKSRLATIPLNPCCLKWKLPWWHISLEICKWY